MRLKIVPRAPKNSVEGVLGDALKVKISSPPVEGEANRTLIAFLSGILGVKKSLLSIDSGEKSRIKRVRVNGMTRPELEGALLSGLAGKLLTLAVALLIAFCAAGDLYAKTKAGKTPSRGVRPLAIAAKEFVADGEYEMSSGESVDVGFLRAERSAKKLIVDKAASHVKTLPKVSGLGLDDEEVRAAVSSIIDVSVVDRKTDKKKGSTSIRVRLKARITEEKFVRIIERARDKSFVKRYRLVEEAYASSDKAAADKLNGGERMFQAAVHFEEGFRRDLAKEPEKAIEAYTKVIDLNPDFAYAYNNRGLALGEKGRFEEAIRDFNKAIALKPDFAFAYNNRGLAYADTAQFALAIEDFNKAITLHPKDADTFNNRGIAWFNKNEFGKAIVDFDKAIELNPESAFVYNNRGNAYKGLLKHDKAIADYDKAIKLRPDAAAPYNNRGLAFAYKKDFDAALKDFDKAVELDGKNADAYNNRANAYRRKELYDKAVADYTKALSLNPKLSFAYFNRGNTLKQKGEIEKAIEDYTRHISLTPDNADAYSSRAFLYYKKGLVDKAVEDFKTACAMGDKYSCKSLKKLGRK